MLTTLKPLLLKCLKTGKHTHMREEKEVARDMLSVVQLQSLILQSLATCLCAGPLTPRAQLSPLPLSIYAPVQT